jgi:hypothetical protein
MNRSLISREILPLGILFAALVLATLLFDALLHRLQLVWIGRYLGIPGVLLILASMLYPLHKHHVIEAGNPRTLLRLHEGLAWFGSLLVLVHAGIHFNAILPWLATAAMLVNVISGLTGKFLLARARRHLDSSRQRLLSAGMTGEQVETKLFWDATAVDLLKRWRVIHFPIAFAFAVAALAHIVSIFLFWGWR